MLIQANYKDWANPAGFAGRLSGPTPLGQCPYNAWAFDAGPGLAAAGGPALPRGSDVKHRTHPVCPGPRFRLLLGLALALLAGTPDRLAAQALILRNLTRLPGVQVEEFDWLLVRASNGQAYGWDQLLRGQTRDPELQTRFDQTLKGEGEAWMRLVLRGQQGDLRGAGEVAATAPLAQYSLSLEPAAASAIETAVSIRRLEQEFLLARARLEHGLETGRHATALLAFWQVIQRQPRLGPDFRHRWETLLLPAIQIQEQRHPRLIPIWFDGQDNAAGHAALLEALGDTQPAPPPLEALLASLEVELGQLESAAERLRRLEPLARDDVRLRRERNLVQAALALRQQQPEKVPVLLEADDSPLANYYRAAAQQEIQPNSAAAILGWMSVAAEARQEQPSLAAAGLASAAAAAAARGDTDSADKIRHELWQRYPHSYHARSQSRAVGNQEALR